MKARRRPREIPAGARQAFLLILAFAGQACALNFNSPLVRNIAGGAPAPKLVGIVPTSGGAGGGTVLTLNGSDFQASPLPSISINGLACASVTYVSSSQLTCITPAQSVGGAYPITVANPDGQSASLPGSF